MIHNVSHNISIGLVTRYRVGAGELESWRIGEMENLSVELDRFNVS